MAVVTTVISYFFFIVLDLLLGEPSERMEQPFSIIATIVLTVMVLSTIIRAIKGDESPKIVNWASFLASILIFLFVPTGFWLVVADYSEPSHVIVFAVFLFLVWFSHNFKAEEKEGADHMLWLIRAAIIIYLIGLFTGGWAYWGEVIWGIIFIAFSMTVLRHEFSEVFDDPSKMVDLRIFQTLLIMYCGLAAMHYGITAML